MRNIENYTFFSKRLNPTKALIKANREREKENPRKKKQFALHEKGFSQHVK
jgi:hypothetical protein